MKTYHINELEQLTGIKAHTIRIWEKRYNLVTPERTTTNRRNYDDDQVRKLLNVATLLSQGFKISKIAALSENEINTQLQKEVRNETKDNIAAAHINDLIKSMITFDERSFEKVFSAAVLRFGFYETMLQVVYPFLNKTGILWAVDKTAPVQEHFAINIINRKILAATDGLMPHTVKGQKFLLFLPQNEWHEIGLLFANYIIRSRGHETIYLGQNVPYSNIHSIAPLINPDYMLLFYVAPKHKTDIKQNIKDLAQKHKNIKILIAGNMDLLQHNESNFKNVTYLTDVNSLMEYLHN